MKRKLLSLVLALALCLSLVIPALAADTPTEKEVPDGAYTMTRQGAEEYVTQPIRAGIFGDFDEYSTAYPGYYPVSSDAAWTIANTSTEANARIGISVDVYVPVGNNDFGAGVGYGILIDRNGKSGGNTALGSNWDELDKLRPGDSVNITMDFLLSEDGVAPDIAELNTHEGREADDVNGILLILGVHKYLVDSEGYAGNSANDFYCYMVNGEAPTEQVPTVPTTDPNTTTPLFEDVKGTDWFHDPVQWAVEHNITNGTSATTFSPNATCTTAQILTFLWRASGSPEPAINNPFTDIQPSDYYYKAALWATEKGIVSGTAFDADSNCTRASTVEYMWKAAGNPVASYDGRFTDVSANADCAQAVAWALENGVTSGTSATTFSPNDTCTRGQIVTFLYRAFAQ